MQSVRILEIPACRMVSSGIGMFGEEKFDAFGEWISSQKRTIFPKDFLFWQETGFNWIYMYEEGMNVPPEFSVIDFTGGLYAVATDIDQQTDSEKMKAEVDEFLTQNALVRDDSRNELGNIITTPAVRDIIGFEQIDYYFPVKKKGNIKCQ